MDTKYQKTKITQFYVVNSENINFISLIAEFASFFSFTFLFLD